MKNLSKSLIFCISIVLGEQLMGQSLPILHSVWTTNATPYQGNGPVTTQIGSGANASGFGTSYGFNAGTTGSGTAVGAAATADNGGVAIGYAAFAGAGLIPNQTNVCVGDGAQVNNNNPGGVTNAMEFGRGLATNENSVHFWGQPAIVRNADGTISLAPTVAGGGSVTPAAIAAAGGVTNGMVGEVLLFTNNVAMLPNLGYTNWPSSTTAGIQEILNMYSVAAIPGTCGGVRIHLASAANSNRPAFYTITKCINATNYFSLEGNGCGATVVEYKGAGYGSRNDFVPQALMLYTPPYITGGASNALGYFALKDLSMLSDIDTNAALVVTYENALEVRNCQFGNTNLINTNYVAWPKYCARAPIAPLGLIGIYAQGGGNNQLLISDTWFQYLADGILCDTTDWGEIDNCYFQGIGAINNGSLSFTNTWNTNVEAHVGACIAINQGTGIWRLKNCVGLNANTLFYIPTPLNLSTYDCGIESCNWYALGSLPMTFASVLPSGGNLGIWSAVNTFYQANNSQPSTVNNGFFVGKDANDDYQYKILDDTLATMISFPNKAEQNNDGALYSVGPIVFTGNRGLEVANMNGHGVTNTAQNTVTFTNFLLGSSFTNTTTRNVLVVGNARCNPTTTGNALVALVTSPTGTTYTTNSIVGLEADVIFTTAPHSWYQLTAQIPPGGIWKFIDKTGEGFVTMTNSYYQVLQ